MRYRIEVLVGAANSGDPMASAIANHLGNVVFGRAIKSRVLTFEHKTQFPMVLPSEAALQTIAKDLQTGPHGLPVQEIRIFTLDEHAAPAVAAGYTWDRVG